MSESSDDWEELSSTASSPLTTPVITPSQSISPSNTNDVLESLPDILSAAIPYDVAESNASRVPNAPQSGYASTPIVGPPRTLISFVPVLEQIRSSLVLEGNEYHLASLPTQSEWIKLQAYARPVEELSISDDLKSPRIVEVIYFVLGQLQGITNPLFPSLSQLRLASTTHTSLSHLFLFFSPALRTVELRGLTNSARATLSAFLQRAGKETFLTTLILDPINLIPEVVRSIANCHSLEVLELRTVKESWHASLLNDLAGLPQLKRLTLDTTKIVGPYQRMGGPSRLPSLTSLHLTGPISTLNDTMSDYIDISSLLTLHIHIVDHQRELGPRSSGWQSDRCLLKVFRRIAGSCSEPANKLTSLTLAFSNEKFGFARDTRLPNDYLTMFFTLKNLQHFEITRIEIPGLERILAELGPHWPLMQALLLPVTNQASISLSTVVTLARSCPNLTSLQVPITIPHDVFALPGVAPADVLSHRLTFLSVGSPANSDLDDFADRMDNLDYVARWLYATFPNIQDIRTHHGHQEGFWTNVGRLVKLCQDAGVQSQARYN